MRIPRATRGCFTPGLPKSSTQALGAEDAAIAKRGSTWSRAETSKDDRPRHAAHRRRRRGPPWDHRDALTESLSRIEDRDASKCARARERPGRDDKVITGWNGLMLRAFADGSRILDRDDFREIAERNAEFVLEHLQRDGRLLRSWKDGDAQASEASSRTTPSYIDGLLALYRATLTRDGSTRPFAWRT